jgi:putative transposase
MSRKGNCYDNAPMESFWGTMKNELIHHKRYSTRTEAAKDIIKYIEVYYNTIRIQERLNFLSPRGFLTKFYERRKMIA